MSSLPSLNYTFRSRVDNFAEQVSCDQDPKFWFRREIAADRDNITDFFLGAFDPALGGELLEAAYKKLNRRPTSRIVFGDILSSRPGDAVTIENAKVRLLGYATQMLASYGRTVRVARIETRRDKVDLVIDT